MRIAINAMTISPGGGMTVICGLLQSLREAAPDWTLIVLTSYEDTHHAVTNTGAADRVERILPGASAARLFLWQNMGIGRWLVRNHIDAVITVNHFMYNIPCPQIVYHLNLLRFLKLQPNRFSMGAFTDWLRDCSARSAVTHATANVFESRYLQDAAESVCAVPAHNGNVIYIGLPDKLIELADRESAGAPGSRRIVCITSPAEHKDNPTLIRMLAELVTRDARENWHLDFAGGISHDVWMPLINLARNLDVEDRITWHGFCNQDQLTKLLEGALCLVSTSRVESFAMVALEAMARQCPPIVADCASMPESIGDAGLLATPGDAKSFADAVMKLANSPELRDDLVQRGRKRIAGFRWHDCGVAFARLIGQLTSRCHDQNCTRGHRKAS